MTGVDNGMTSGGRTSASRPHENRRKQPTTRLASEAGIAVTALRKIRAIYQEDLVGDDDAQALADQMENIADVVDAVLDGTGLSSTTSSGRP